MIEEGEVLSRFQKKKDMEKGKCSELNIIPVGPFFCLFVCFLLFCLLLFFKYLIRDKEKVCTKISSFTLLD